MCEPYTIAAGIATAVQVGTQIAGGVMEGEAQGQAARAQADELEFQAQQERRNVELARNQASDITQRGAVAAGETEAEGRTVAAGAVAAMGGSGVDSSSGTNASVVARSETNAAVDANRIRVNAAREAWGFRQEAEQREAQAKRLRKARQEVLRGGYLSQVGTGLRTAGQVVETGASFAKSVGGS